MDDATDMTMWQRDERGTMEHDFTFMGTAAGCGVPSFFCDCPACEEARADPRLARGDCGVMIRRAEAAALVGSQALSERDANVPTLMIDTPPDARHQLLREGVRWVDEILFTHCHFDHIGGLGEYEYLVALKRGGVKLPAFGTEETICGLRREFGYLDYVIDWNVLGPGETHVFDGVRYTPLAVTHAPGTVGYLIETADTRLFYASDTAELPPETAERIRGVDVLALDATFWKKNWNPRDHHSVQECIAEGLALDAKKLYLTHMCMHYDEPITYAELVAYLAQYDGRVEAAMDGLTFAL